MARAAEPIGAISVPSDTFLTLEIAQSRLERGLVLRQGMPLVVRVRHDPVCQFKAELQQAVLEFAVRDGFVTVQANPTDLPECAAHLRQGSAIVARLATSPKSVVERIRISVSRLLQDRLPVNINQL